MPGYLWKDMTSLQKYVTRAKRSFYFVRVCIVINFVVRVYYLIYAILLFYFL